ncbi:hypothetical protein NEH83_37050 [Streptomyces sp. JUS-F4]|uniref:hypothetical protein n=1 Tax=Streptomyces TaxID=1883 RepID=UPI000CD58D7B|nr:MULTISPECIES: hypothetical protein [Streptomyces]MDX2674811.1 hypothetical protein [Streptomyces sp. NRRL_ISP-5395]WKN19298.1 hypothetical protein NEH83_37050 [Streptomyces sp. JUS-F4]GHF92744.1 hypothetical protein GCM10010504_71280 [Streptomyces griseus]
MTRDNKPPRAFRPVRQALDAAGYGPDVYADKTFLLDYTAGFIPKPPADATAEEFDNVVLAAKLCARARTYGHLCPALKGRLRAMNPDPGVTRELRKALREGVENLLKRPRPPTPRLNVYSHRAIEALLPLSPEPVLGMIAHLAPIWGFSHDQIVAFLKDVQETPRAKPAVWKANLLTAFLIMCDEMGQSLHENPLNQTALEEAFLAANPRAGRLRELLVQQGYTPKSTPDQANDMVSLFDMVSTANLTDTKRALQLLDESDDVVLRGTVLLVGRARRTGGFPHEDHHFQRCRAAADWDALITCQILDPRTFAWWKAAYGDFRSLRGVATEFMAEVARRAREEY